MTREPRYNARPAICRQGGLLPPYCGLPRGHDGPHDNAHTARTPETTEERAAALYRAANACADTDLKTAIELRQLAGKIERGEA